MYNVLVPVDDSETRAFHQARYVARLPNAETDVAATVLHVAPPGRFESPDGVDFSAFDAAVDAAEHLEAAGIPVTRVAESGGVERRIAAAIEDVDADEVVVGGRKRTGVLAALIGSTAHDVSLSADRPVTITGEHASLGEGTRTVLLPVDSNEARARTQANYVIDLPGDPDDVEVVVYHVFRHQDYAGAPPHDFSDADAAVAVADALESAGITVERVAVGGEVTRTIVDAAADRDVDSIVVGGRKRSGVQAVLFGSTAQDIVLSADRPVTITG